MHFSKSNKHSKLTFKTKGRFKKKRLMELSKPQPNPNLNTTVGLTMKMTLHTPPPTQTFQALLDELES